MRPAPFLGPKRLCLFFPKTPKPEGMTSKPREIQAGGQEPQREAPLRTMGQLGLALHDSSPALLRPTASSLPSSLPAPGTSLPAPGTTTPSSQLCPLRRGPPAPGSPLCRAEVLEGSDSARSLDGRPAELLAQQGLLKGGHHEATSSTSTVEKEPVCTP